ncbi:MAG: hypothetical protein OEY37_11940, partial [Gammaproteobacteria bacterium]|nr:hypothetical protein [Gammaproteobacteria bacterium]
DIAAALVEAVETSGGLSREVPAALMYLAIGDTDAARLIANKLKSNLQPQNRAYAALIDGRVALAAGDAVAALDSISSGVALADLWLLRFHRGIAYLEAGYAAEALDEFTACFERRGEVSALFLDDLPTWHYMATLPYWQGRAQQELGMLHDARQNYMTFISRRPEADALANDARQRMQ